MQYCRNSGHKSLPMPIDNDFYHTFNLFKLFMIIMIIDSGWNICYAAYQQWILGGKNFTFFTFTFIKIVLKKVLLLLRILYKNVQKKF